MIGKGTSVRSIVDSKGNISEYVLVDVVGFIS
jgi:hypothetical protein